MKELITRIEELALQLEAANRQIEISATDARDALGQLNRANKKLGEMRDDGNRLRDELDSAINECERLRVESKEIIGELRAAQDATKAECERIRVEMGAIHATDIELLERLTAKMTLIETVADACGRTEGESVVEFMKRVKQETRYT